MNTERTTEMAWGQGLASIAADGTVLDTWFRSLGWGESVPDDAPSVDAGARFDGRRGVQVMPVRIVIDVTAAPKDASDVYLRLHLLSHRFARPRSLNLDGAFGLLANVAWTNFGPVALDFTEVQSIVLAQESLTVPHGQAAEHVVNPDVG